MIDRLNFVILAFIVALSAALAPNGAAAQQAIGSTVTSHNEVTRDLRGATAPLSVGDSVYRDEIVRTGSDSLAKLVFLDSTNLAVGPTSRVALDRFVYEGDPSSEKVAVGLAKGLFRFSTGKLDKKAYTITTPTAAIGVRGTVLDIDVGNTETRVTLVEGRALVCPRRKGVTFEQQARNCGKDFGGAGGDRTGKCECAELDHPGQTAKASYSDGKTTADMTDDSVDFASLCSGDASLCSQQNYPSGPPGTQHGGPGSGSQGGGGGGGFGGGGGGGGGFFSSPGGLASPH